MELLKRLLLAHGLHESVAFHDVRFGGEHDGRFVWVLLNSGSAGAYAFNHDPDTLRGVHSYRQPPAYFPIPGGTFAGESLPGTITWARAWLDREELVMDVGRGEVVALPPARARRMVGGNDTAMAVHGRRPRDRSRRPHGALPEQPRRGRVRRRVRRHGRALSSARFPRPRAGTAVTAGVVLGVDAGTASVRAGCFTTDGRLVGRGEHAIELWSSASGHVEQSSADIWAAVAQATRAAVAAAGVSAEPRARHRVRCDLLARRDRRCRSPGDRQRHRRRRAQRRGLDGPPRAGRCTGHRRDRPSGPAIRRRFDLTRDGDAQAAVVAAEPPRHLGAHRALVRPR